MHPNEPLNPYAAPNAPIEPSRGRSRVKKLVLSPRRGRATALATLLSIATMLALEAFSTWQINMNPVQHLGYFLGAVATLGVLWVNWVNFRREGPLDPRSDPRPAEPGAPVGGSSRMPGAPPTSR